MTFGEQHDDLLVGESRQSGQGGSAVMSAVGTASIALDTLALAASGMTTA